MQPFGIPELPLYPITVLTLPAQTDPVQPLSTHNLLAAMASCFSSPLQAAGQGAAIANAFKSQIRLYWTLFKTLLVPNFSRVKTQTLQEAFNILHDLASLYLFKIISWH